MAKPWGALGANTLALPARNLYPTAGGSTTGTRAGAQTLDSGANVSENKVSSETSAVAPGVAAAVAARGGPLGQPLSWWAIIFVLLVVLMHVAERVGKEGEFGNVKLSAYNILVITLASMIGFGFFKVVFARVHVPGLSTYVHAV